MTKKKTLREKRTENQKQIGKKNNGEARTQENDKVSHS